MVSLIQSNYRGMGSGLVADGLGFMFQDRGELFSLNPKARECLCAGQAAVPHHHPRLRDEGRQAVHGVRPDGRRHAAARPCAGADQHDRFRHERAGSRRRRALAPLWQRRTHGRAVNQGIGTVEMESGFDPEVKEELEKRGYKVVPRHRRLRRLSGDPVRRARTRLLGRAPKCARTAQAIGY